MRSRTLLACAAGVLMLTATACGDDDDASSDATEAPATDAPATQPPATEAPVTDPPATAAPTVKVGAETRVYLTDGSVQRFELAGGFVEVSGNNVTILAT